LTLWRGDLYPERSILALVGRNEAAPLDPATLAAQWRAMTGEDTPDAVLADRALKFYAGNAASGLFAHAPANTDDHPLIEFMAPRTHCAVIAGTARFLVGRERDRLYADLMDAMPPESDPHLSRLTPAQAALPVAGALYAEWQGMRHRDDPRAATLWRQFTLITPQPRQPRRTGRPRRHGLWRSARLIRARFWALLAWVVNLRPGRAAEDRCP